ncbi:Nucleotidylyl transferase [Athelia psychrophila]|uniref:Tryptophanyl-tRNA synthetase n=1 Tax=Athelia psychrophila TaxID=1759441 RepID=A0A166M1Z3_9AGAM|nr:Nucleotidylyl transferase [Fibularhizoctonia sp. CBS 109695]
MPHLLRLGAYHRWSPHARRRPACLGREPRRRAPSSVQPAPTLYPPLLPHRPFALGEKSLRRRTRRPRRAWASSTGLLRSAARRRSGRERTRGRTARWAASVLVRRTTAPICFDINTAFTFSDYDYMGGEVYRNVSRTSRQVSYNQVKSTLGFTDSCMPSCSGGVAGTDLTSPAMTGTTSAECTSPPSRLCRPSPTLSRTSSTAHLPFHASSSARSTRTVLPPRARHRFQAQVPEACAAARALLTRATGPQTKMSASDPNSSIFMSDAAGQIQNKFDKHRFSGGREAEGKHMEFPGDPDVDIAYQYLTFLLEDDAALEALSEHGAIADWLVLWLCCVVQEYSAETLLTGQLKTKCAGLLQVFVKDFQEWKAKVTEKIRYIQGLDAQDPTELQEEQSGAVQLGSGEAAPRSKTLNLISWSYICCD